MLKPLTMWITANCGKFFKRWEYQTILPASLEACMQVKKQQNGSWNTSWFKIGKAAHQGYILSSCLFNLYAGYIMWNARLDEAQARIKIAGRNINNLKYTDDTTLMAESSVQFRPHGLQHARLSCLSPTPGAYSNSCPSHRWCHPTISSSVISFSSCLQSFPASGSFPKSQFFPSDGQSIGVSASASVLPMHIQDWFPLGWTG